MTPQYEYNPSKVSASIEVLDADTGVEFKIGKPKAFMKVEGETVKNFGVRIPIERASDGKKSVMSLYLHNDGGESMAKQFQMAVYGYKSGKPNEVQFDKDHGGDDWRLDFETGDVGEAWQKLEGNRAVADVVVKPNPNTGEPSNNFNRWRPIS